jgi:copper chaperone NosL
MKNKLPAEAKAILIFSALALIVVLFVPMWKIELNAPQYPEGLVLKIYPHKIGGNVDIVNGLNHYIGMKTLHTKDFIEFTLLPYIIGFFSLLSLIALFLNRRKWLYVLTVLFIIFGVVAMVDFWRWEYNYGHDLDPAAAIQVPGMAYQPPLIGYKQLLNFGAYSIPDTGGYIFFGVGILLLITSIVLLVKGRRARKVKVKDAALVMMAMVFFSSCNTAPDPIKIGVDGCSFCKMTISDNRFGGEIITQKGKVYKFDDMHCLLAFHDSAGIKKDFKSILFVEFNRHDLIPSGNALLLKSEGLHTPMGGNVAAFNTPGEIKEAMQKYPGEQLTWAEMIKK